MATQAVFLLAKNDSRRYDTKTKDKYIEYPIHGLPSRPHFEAAFFEVLVCVMTKV
jgi:hypothetical protein